MKKLMKSNGDAPERKPRLKMEKKIKEKINLFTVKVGNYRFNSNYYYKCLFQLKDLPYNTKKKDIKKFFKPIAPFSIRIPRNVHGFAYVGFKTEKLFKKALIKDRSFISE